MTHGTPKLIRSGNAVELSILDNGVALVKFDCQDSKVNLLSSAVLQELDAVLAILENGQVVGSAIKGVVFYSGKADCFIAGADIKEIQIAQELPIDQVFEACYKGKSILDRISSLPMRTVGAVHGRCLGGGTEMFLRFQFRLASHSSKTVFGLPEVGLGVIPGWGGCIKLPRLVGFQPALSMILDPLHPWSADKAAKHGLVTELVPWYCQAQSELLERAICVACGDDEPAATPPSLLARAQRRFFDSRIGRSLAAALARTLVRFKLGDKVSHPAPFKALELMEASFTHGEADALNLESGAFAVLSHSDGCKQGVQKFLAYQAAKKQKAAGANAQ